MLADSRDPELVIEVNSISESRHDWNWLDRFTAKMLVNGSVGGLFRITAKTANSGKENLYGRQ